MRRARSEPRVPQRSHALHQDPVTLLSVQPLDLTELAGQLEISEQATHSLLDTVNHWPDTPLSPPPPPLPSPNPQGCSGGHPTLESQLETHLNLGAKLAVQSEVRPEVPSEEDGDEVELLSEAELLSDLDMDVGSDDDGSEVSPGVPLEVQLQSGSRALDDRNTLTPTPLKLWASIRRLWDMFVPPPPQQDKPEKQRQRQQPQESDEQEEHTQRPRPKLKQRVNSQQAMQKPEAPSQPKVSSPTSSSGGLSTSSLPQAQTSSSNLAPAKEKLSMASQVSQRLERMSIQPSPSVVSSLSSRSAPNLELPKPRSQPPTASSSALSSHIMTGLTNPTARVPIQQAPDRPCAPLVQPPLSLQLPVALSGTPAPSGSRNEAAAPPQLPLLPLPQPDSQLARPVSDMFENDLCEADLSPAARPSDDDLSYLRNISSPPPVQLRDRRYSEPQLSSRSAANTSFRRRFSFLPPSPFATPPPTPPRTQPSPLFPSPKYQLNAPAHQPPATPPKRTQPSLLFPSPNHQTAAAPQPPLARVEPSPLFPSPKYQPVAAAAPKQFQLPPSFQEGKPTASLQHQSLSRQPSLFQSLSPGDPQSSYQSPSHMNRPSSQAKAPTDYLLRSQMPMYPSPKRGSSTFEQSPLHRTSYVRSTMLEGSHVQPLPRSASQTQLPSVHPSVIQTTPSRQNMHTEPSPISSEQQPNPTRSKSHRSYFQASALSRLHNESPLYTPPRKDATPSSDSKQVYPSTIRTPLPRAATHHAAFRSNQTGLVAPDPTLDRRIAQLQALQQQLRTQRKQPVHGTNAPSSDMPSCRSPTEFGAMDALSERRRHMLITQQRRLASSLRMPKVGDVPRNIRLPILNSATPSPNSHHRHNVLPSPPAPAESTVFS